MPDSNIPTDGRVRLVYVSFVVWLDSMMNDRRVKCVNMPRAARVVRAIPSTERWHRDVVIWLHSPDFDPVPEGGVIPEFQLQFELHRDDPAVMGLYSSLKELREWSRAEYQNDPAIDARADAALDAYAATFVKVDL